MNDRDAEILRDAATWLALRPRLAEIRVQARDLRETPPMAPYSDLSVYVGAADDLEAEFGPEVDPALIARWRAYERLRVACGLEAIEAARDELEEEDSALLGRLMRARPTTDAGAIALARVLLTYLAGQLEPPAPGDWFEDVLDQAARTADRLGCVP